MLGVLFWTILISLIGEGSFPLKANAEWGEEVPIPMVLQDPEKGSEQGRWVQQARQAFWYFQLGDKGEAERLFSELLEKEPNHSLASLLSFYRLECLWVLGKESEAIEASRAFFWTFPWDWHTPEVLSRLGTWFQKKGQFDEANAYWHVLRSRFPAAGETRKLFP